ncbi:MAG: extracellular solute-binding protein [Chloroflexi bacterium]|nr:extracellular solute-binding protein [Chloroflexota bacterium]
METCSGRTTRRGYLRWLGTVPAGALAACDVDGGRQEATNKSVQPARIQWQMMSDAEYPQLAAEATALFRQQYPQITIEPQTPPGGGAARLERTLTTMVAGEGPDVIQLWAPFVLELAGRGQLQNLNELVRELKKSDVDDFHKFQWDGQVIPTTTFRWGLPAYVDMDVLYYNKQLFRERGVKEPTADWGRDEYATALKQLTFTDASGRKVWGGYKPVSGYVRFQNMVTMFGGHVVDPKDLTKTTLHLAEAQRGLEWARARLFDDQSWAPINQAQATWQPPTPLDGLSQGAVAIYEAGLGALNRIAQGMQAEWDIQHVPKGPARRAALGDTDGWEMWKETKVKDAAWAWMKFITSPAYYEMQSRHVLRIPSRRSALDTWVKVVRERVPALARVNLKVATDAMTSMGYLTPTESFLCPSEAETVVTRALQQIFRDGTARPILFRDIRDQIEAAAARCGYGYK